MRKRLGVTLALFFGIALLAVPTSAGAAVTMITTAPIKVRNYQMTVVAADTKKGSLSVIFTRKAKKNTQTHVFTFDKNVRVTRNSINARLGRYGRINLKFGALRQARGKNKLPAGCTGRPARTRTGTLNGRLRFVADRKFFRTITARSIRGAVSIGGRLDCSGSGGDPAKGDGDGDGGFGKGEPMLSLSKQEPGDMLSLTATKRSIAVLKMETGKRVAPAQIVRTILVTGPGRLQVAPDASATVRGQAPFLPGNGQFSPTQNLGMLATGTLGGNLAARFDSVGRVPLSGDATLLNP